VHSTYHSGVPRRVASEVDHPVAVRNDPDKNIRRHLEAVFLENRLGGNEQSLFEGRIRPGLAITLPRLSETLAGPYILLLWRPGEVSTTCPQASYGPGGLPSRGSQRRAHPEWPGSRTPSLRRPHFTTVFRQSRYGVLRHEAAEA